MSDLSAPTHAHPFGHPSSVEPNTRGAWKAVFTVVERPASGAGGERKKLWVRIGTAFPNRNSMTVRLDASPVNGELVIKDPLPTDPARGRSLRGGRFAPDDPETP